MTTPLQKAAKALINRWDLPAWRDQPHTAHCIAELRKALDAELAQTETGNRNLRVTEIAQSVEPVAWVSKHDVLYSFDDKCAVDPVNELSPLYLHPPQPQATTPAVPEGYVLVPVEPTPAMCAEGLEDEGLTIKDGFKYAYALYTCMVKTAQGEKP